MWDLVTLKWDLVGLVWDLVGLAEVKYFVVTSCVRLSVVRVSADVNALITRR